MVGGGLLGAALAASIAPPHRHAIYLHLYGKGAVVVGSGAVQGAIGGGVPAFLVLAPLL